MYRVEEKPWSDLVYWNVFHEWTKRPGYFWGESNDPRFSITRMLSTIRWAKNALSVGCGTGLVERFLPTNMDVVGIDTDMERLGVAWQMCPWTMFMRGEATRIPFKDNAFDLVLAVSVIEFIEDKEAFVAEMRRVLRPAGWGLICTPNAEHPNYADMVGKMTNAEIAALLDGFEYTKWTIITWKDEEDDRFIVYQVRKPTEG